jgi:hypothetical protein
MQAAAGRPEMLVELRTGAGRITIPVGLDSGAQYTLVNGEELEGIGFAPPPGADPATDRDCIRFGGIAGGNLLGYAFDVEMRVNGTGIVYDFRVYGSLVRIPRSVLGRDFFSRLLVGFHDAREEVYLDSLHDRHAPPIENV